MPLIAETLARNVATFRNSVADVLTEGWYDLCELEGDACDELCIANVSTASWKEKAGTKTALLMILANDSASNRRLSRADQAAELEYAPLILPISRFGVASDYGDGAGGRRTPPRSTRVLWGLPTSGPSYFLAILESRLV